MPPVQAQACGSLDRQYEIAERHPIKRCGTPEEVAALVSFLLSDAASFCTGGYYLADGGYMAQ